MGYEASKQLFEYEGREITYGDIVDALHKVGADECDILFVHSDISFGRIAGDMKRKELMDALVSGLLETGVPTIMFPTFTFSFCNREDYDRELSRTAMGMLPEYVRKRPDAYRTDDPIMSVAILGDRTGFEGMDGDSSCGIGGIFHQLHRSGKKVKFLFFGTSPMKCFTFLHYVEEIRQVPYRYTRQFTGNVIINGKAVSKSVNVYVRYKDVQATLPACFYDDLLCGGIAETVVLGRSEITSVDEEKAYEYISGLIDQNQYVFANLPESGILEKEYAYGGVTTM